MSPAPMPSSAAAILAGGHARATIVHMLAAVSSGEVIAPLKGCVNSVSDLLAMLSGEVMGAPPPWPHGCSSRTFSGRSASAGSRSHRGRSPEDRVLIVLHHGEHDVHDASRPPHGWRASLASRSPPACRMSISTTVRMMIGPRAAPPSARWCSAHQADVVGQFSGGSL